MAKPVIASNDTVKDFEKNLPILDIPEDRFLLISPAGDMMNCAGRRYAQRASHKHTMSVQGSNVKKIDVTPAILELFPRSFVAYRLQEDSIGVRPAILQNHRIPEIKEVMYILQQCKPDPKAFPKAFPHYEKNSL